MGRIYPGLARRGRYLYPLLFLALDYLAILLAEYVALEVQRVFTIHPSPFRISPAYFYVWIPCISLLFLLQSHAYEEMRPVIDMVRSIFYALVYGALAGIFILFLMTSGGKTSRLFVVAFFLFSLVFVYAERYIALKFMKRIRLFYEPVVLVGAGKTAERVLRFYDGDLGCRYRVQGIIDDAPVSRRLAENYLLYGDIAHAQDLVRRAAVQTIIIAAPGLGRERLQHLIEDIQPHVRNILFVPDLIGTPLASVDAQTLFAEEILMLCVRNNLARRRNRIYKRCFDLICTIFGGLLLSPLLLFLTLIVAVNNRGHVIFAHQRVGRGGKLFPCYKFQTMVRNADAVLEQYLAAHPEARAEWEANFKLKEDPRVTKLGAFLRKTSLDELPQLINVLKGEMSLVGPRPIVTKEIPRYGENFREYAMVLPGITGMWQVSGRSDTTYEERVEMDTWYVRNWSIWVDLMYLFKTAKAVFTSKGAY